jgi:hypothetical protein
MSGVQIFNIRPKINFIFFQQICGSVDDLARNFIIPVTKLKFCGHQQGVPKVRTGSAKFAHSMNPVLPVGIRMLSSDLKKFLLVPP